MPTPYELWLADQKKKQQEAAQNAKLGKVNFKEASTASRPQYTLPGYQGQSETKNYDWETNILGGLKGKGIGKSNNDKFDYVTKTLGMSPGEAKDFRNFLDYQYDSQQTIKTNKDGSVAKNQNVRLGQGIRLKKDAQNDIFSNMYGRMSKDIAQKNLVPLQKVENSDKLKNFLGWNYDQAQKNYLQAKEMGLNPDKPITKDAWNQAQQKALVKTSQDVSGEGNGLYSKINAGAERIGNAFWNHAFGQEFNNADNQWQQQLAIDELKKNPNDKKAIQQLQAMNAALRPAKNKTEKALDFIGSSGGEVAPYVTGGATGVAEGIASKSGLQLMKNAVAKTLTRGAIAGAISGSEKAGARHVLSGETLTPAEYAKQIGSEAGIAGGGDAVLGLLGRNLNLKNHIGQLNEGLGYQHLTPEEFQKALQEAFSQKGNASNVLADAQKVMPKPYESLYPGVKSLPKNMNGFKPKELPKVDVPPANDEWFTFAQSGQVPKARGAQQANAGRYTREMIGKQADNILSQSNALKNAPEGGYNQRLLDVQKDMQNSLKTNPKTINDSFLNFGQSSKYEPKARMNTAPIERSSSIDPLHRSQTYWKTRYYDFAQNVQSNFHPNDLSEEKLQTLWEKYAKKDEPKNLHDVVDLAYGNGSAGLSNNPINVESRLNEITKNTKTNTSSIKIPNKNINELYQAVKQPNDPETFDDLVKLAEMEHNAASQPKNLKKMLHADPRVNEALQKLNKLGGLPKKLEAPNLVPPSVGNTDDLLKLLNPNIRPKTETITPNGMKLNIPEAKSNLRPTEKIQNFLNGEKPSQPLAAGKKGLPSLKEMMGNLEPKPKQVPVTAPRIEPIPTVNNSKSLTPEVSKSTKVSPLKSIKTDKEINSMTNDELQSVYQKLIDTQKKVSRSGNKTKLQEVEDDLNKVSGLLKMNLQFFGERAHPLFEDLPDTLSHIGSKTDKKGVQLKPLADKAYIKTVDNLHRLSQFDKQVEDVLGRQLNPSEKTHLLGLNSRGSDMISKQILTENMVDKSGNVVGDSLKSITSKIPKGKYKEFEDYLVNQHAITRMDRGEKVFPDEMQMTPDKSRAIVKKYEETHPEFKDLAQEYYRYNRQLGEKWLVDEGILSKDEWKAYLRENPHYVPNNRIFSDMERPLFYGTKKGFGNQSNPIKKAVGSQRKIVSPIESTIEHTAQYIKTAKRNEVMQTLINNIKQDPDAFKGWAEIVPTEKGAGTYLDSIANKLKDEGIDGVLDEFNKAFDQKPDLTKGNIVRGLIDGKPVHVKVHDPALLDALTNLQPKAQNVVVHALGQVTRVMKNLTTGINPIFSLTRNIWRDIPTAYTNSKTTNNPFVFSKDLVQSVVSVIKNDELYRSFKAVGGGHASPLSSDVNLLAQSKRSILPLEPGLWNKTKSVGGKVMGGLENLNNAVEAAPRLAEFKRIAKKGDYNSMMKGLYEANDVTVNFNKYGNVAKEIDAVIPYFNAAVQGLDKVWRTFVSPSASAAEKTTAGLKAFTAVTIPTILLYTLNHDDPNYQKVSNYVKDTNFLIPKGDGTFIKIPKSRELGVVFGSDIERVLRAWADKDPKAFKDFGTYVWDSFADPGRSIVAPFNDIRSNKNFMNAPIVPGDLQGLSPQYQYDAQTSEPAKKLGSLLNKSPKQIDYLIKSYTGVIGELGIPATTKNASVPQTLKQQVIADPVFSNDIQRNFYDEKTKLDQAHNDLAKQGVKSKNLNEDLRKLFNKKSLEMGKIRKKIKEVQNDSSLTHAERLIQIRDLQEQINQIAESGNQLVR